MKQKRDTYKYWFRVENVNVHCGITRNLKKRESKHRSSKRYKLLNGFRYYWRYGHIVQVGKITTRSAAFSWERQHKCNANWN